jgi:hypothetical protein
MVTNGDQLAYMVVSLREEILNAASQQTFGVLAVALGMVGLYTAAVLSKKYELYCVVVVMAIASVYYAARQDLIVHRAAAYLVYTEGPAGKITTSSGQVIQTWEEWKSGLVSTKFLLPFLDIFSSATWLYLVYCAEQFLWRDGKKKFVAITVLLLAIGIACVPLSVWLAGK